MGSPSVTSVTPPIAPVDEPAGGNVGTVESSDVADRGSARDRGGAPAGASRESISASIPINVPIGPADHTLAPPDRPALFQLSAGTESSQASLALTRTVSRPNLGSIGEGLGTFTAVTIGAQAPLAKDVDTTNLATLDGLADSFAIKIGFSQFRVALRDPGPAMAALEAKALKACRADIRVSDKVACDLDANRNPLLQTYLSREEYDAYLGGGFPGGASLAFGLAGRLGCRKFDYLEVPATAKGSVGRVPWSVGGYLTLLPGAVAASLTTAVEFQRLYKAAATQSLCSLTPGAVTVECVSGAGGRPSRKDGLLLSLEGRRQFATGSLILPSVGVAPQVTYDALQDRVGLDLPIYLVSDDKGGLLGGVRVGWTSGDGGFVAGVFVGSLFSLFK